MQLLDRIEKRRFVGREFLLFLWFESEILDATLSTAENGSFGLWIERQLVLSAGKEQTRIKGALPGAAREAKEALRRGKLPELAGIHLSLGDKEHAFVLKAEKLALSGLSLPTALDKEEREVGEGPKELLPPRRPRRRGGKGEDVDDAAHEAFYERMHLTRDVESLVEALYRDFLALRLGPAWSAVVFPPLTAWVRGDARGVDVETYRAARDAAGRRTRRR